MSKRNLMKAMLAGSVCAAALAGPALAENFSIPAGDLNAALSDYSAATGVQLIVSADAVRGVRTRGVRGELSTEAALTRILVGTGFVARLESGAAIIVPARDEAPSARVKDAAPIRVASTQAAAASVETVVVTSSKIKGDIQTVPIAITALSQEQLTSRQIAGGPDLVKEVPNLTFSKTNFTGYNIEIRGIGTQAISVATDPAVAVAFNDIPFIRNHFFEQEFYDVSQVEVLRGPQGTLYGRNATAGVVNVVSAKPTDQFEAMLSADWGNYSNRRYEGMVNIPIVDDRADIRIAGEWTKRDGYSFNTLTNSPIEGRDLWSTRVTIGFKPLPQLQTYLVWEHFQENDDRLRSGKQLCKTDPGPESVGGVQTNTDFYEIHSGDLSQGCLPASLYSPQAYEVPNGYSLPYVGAMQYAGIWDNNTDPYASVVQSRNLRKIESTLNPEYRAHNDIIEFNADYALAPTLTLTSQSAFNKDFLWSAEDFNRFNTSPGAFNPDYEDLTSDTGVFCDPQLGCSDRIVAEDLSVERAWQISQEFRLSSNFDEPFNFSVGGNFLHYETEENYYVFINAITLFGLGNPNNGPDKRGLWVPGVTDDHGCLANTGGLKFPDVTKSQNFGCPYIDPNPIGSLNDAGHNYFLSQNPYVLSSYAGFGEVYYSVANDIKLTGGARWTSDQKHFLEIPSWVAITGYGYPVTGVVDQSWNVWTGRFAADWTPKLDFTDQTLVYGSFARGYKAGGANPPGAMLLVEPAAQPVHPLTFKPEFINAYELGTKNTLLDGALTLNGDVFYYDYKGYQISQIVDRTSINLNFNATVKGAELETSWEPAPGLKFSFAGGYEGTKLAKGSQAVDLIDRTAGNPDWVVVKPALYYASNCILPVTVVKYILQSGYPFGIGSSTGNGDCAEAYIQNVDPLTDQPYVAYPGYSYHGDYIPGYPGFDPSTAPNGGAGFFKDLSGKELPNAPHFTTSLTAEYTLPVSEDWAATLHGDFYWQSQSWARVFNDRPYDKIRGYSNVNLALILTSAEGWQVLGYLKNVFNTTAITGDFLNSDDTGLTTNIFLTDPRLFGVRVTKNF